MYMHGMCFKLGEKKSAFGSLGIDWLSMGASLIGSQAGGSGGGGGAPPSSANINTVTTTVSTQVSPQISPQFIQQQSPSNSPINASSAMAPTGMTPATGAIPGVDYGAYTPQLQSAQESNIMIPLLMAAGILGVAYFAR